MNDEATMQTGLDEGPKDSIRGGGMQNIKSDGTIYRVAKMTPEQFSSFIVHCAVCGDLLPDNRARARRETCGKRECGIRLKQFRKMTIEVRKCPTCYHPSTPQEREDFKQWRKERGQIQRRRGNPHGRRAKTPTELLADALPYLRELKEAEAQKESPDKERLAKLTAQIAEVEKVFPQS